MCHPRCNKIKLKSLKVFIFLVSRTTLHCQKLGIYFKGSNNTTAIFFPSNLLIQLKKTRAEDVLLTFTVDTIIFKLKTTETPTGAVFVAEMGARRA